MAGRDSDGVQNNSTHASEGSLAGAVWSIDSRGHLQAQYRSNADDHGRHPSGLLTFPIQTTNLSAELKVAAETVVHVGSRGVELTSIDEYDSLFAKESNKGWAHRDDYFRGVS